MGTEILLRLERQILLEFFKDVQDLYTQIQDQQSLNIGQPLV